MKADRARHSMIVTFVAATLVTIGNVGYTQYVNRSTEAKFCGVMRVFDTPEPPATLTPRGREIQGRMHELRKGLHC